MGHQAVSLEGRSAFVSGAARGIGLAVARALHERGAAVALADIDREGAAAAAEALDRASAVGLELDVRDRASFAAALAESERRLGPVDILVNNAAVTIARPFFEITDEEWDDVLAVNLRGVLVGCQLAGPGMRKRGHGRIVNLGSIAGQQGSAVNGAHYAASKAGIGVLTKMAARELAAVRRYRQLRRAGRDRRPGHGPAAARSGRGARRLDPGRPAGRAGRRGGGGLLPRLRRGGLRHGRNARPERRRVHALRLRPGQSAARATGAPSSSSSSTRAPGAMPAEARAMTTGPCVARTDAMWTVEPSSRRREVTSSTTPPPAASKRSELAPQPGHNSRAGKNPRPHPSQT